jgi:hypothetical protein
MKTFQSLSTVEIDTMMSQPKLEQAICAEIGCPNVTAASLSSSDKRLKANLGQASLKAR